MASLGQKEDSLSTEQVEVLNTQTTIDPVVEARVRRKLDIRLMPILTLVYLFAFIDR